MKEPLKSISDYQKEIEEQLKNIEDPWILNQVLRTIIVLTREE